MEELNEPQKKSSAGQTVRWIFGLIMIFVYVGMGALLLLNFFSWTIRWISITLGIVFILYGIWRAYRQIKGIDSRL